MIDLLIAFGCGVAAVVLWRRSLVRRTAKQSVPRTCAPSRTWGTEYDVPTYLRRRNARP